MRCWEANMDLPVSSLDLAYTADFWGRRVVGNGWVQFNIFDGKSTEHWKEEGGGGSLVVVVRIVFVFITHFHLFTLHTKIQKLGSWKFINIYRS